MNWVEFITSDKGIFAAVVAVITLLASTMGIFRPLIERLHDRKVAKAKLEMTDPLLTPPPDWSSAGEVSFELSNTAGSKAVLRSLTLRVIDHKPSKTPRMILPGAPIPIHNYKVELNPNKTEYDVCSQIYGNCPLPRSFSEGEVEAFKVQLTSIEAEWYRFRFVAEWYDAKRPENIQTIESPDLEIDFPPDLQNLLKRDNGVNP